MIGRSGIARSGADRLLLCDQRFAWRLVGLLSFCQLVVSRSLVRSCLLARIAACRRLLLSVGSVVFAMMALLLSSFELDSLLLCLLVVVVIVVVAVAVGLVLICSLVVISNLYLLDKLL